MKNIFYCILIILILGISDFAIAQDDFSSYQSALESPGKSAFVITPSDGSNLTTYTRAIYVGVAGDLTVILVGDSSSVTFTAVPAGVILPIRAKKVLSTGTTADDLIGLK